MKQAIRNMAILACESDQEVGKSEFVLYQMKFGNRPILVKQIEWIEAMIGQSDLMDPDARYVNEASCLFS